MESQQHVAQHEAGRPQSAELQPGLAKWPILTSVLVALLVGWLIYDIVLPENALHRMRRMVATEAAPGKLWAEAKAKLTAAGYPCTGGYRIPTEAMYFIRPGGRASRTMYIWLRFVLWERDWVGYNLPADAPYSFSVYVNSSGTITRLWPPS